MLEKKIRPLFSLFTLKKKIYIIILNSVLKCGNNIHSINIFLVYTHNNLYCKKLPSD